MDTHDFPVCCGLTIHANFGNTRNAHNQSKYSKEEVDNFLSRYDDKWVAGQIITLNEEQNKAIGSVVRKHGYRCVSRCYHPNHANDILIFVKNNKHKKRKK